MGLPIRFAPALAALLLGACATLPMGTPPPAPRTIAFLDGQSFALTQPLTFPIGKSGLSVTVPAGFVTDYASVPRSLQWLVGKQGRYSRATILHDYLYWTQRCTRQESDNLLWIMMVQSGVSSSKRIAILDAVRVGGVTGWANNKRVRARGQARVLPADRYALADTMTWRAARDLLTKEGAKEPPMPVDPAVCALGDQRATP